MKHPYKEKLQEEEYFFPYHYLNLLSSFQDIEYLSYLGIIKKELEEARKVMDIGCGDGRFEYGLKDNKINVLGIDLSKQAIAFAKAFNINNENAEFICKDAFNLKIKEKVDAVISIETFEHIKKEKLKELIKKMAKFIKDRGKLIISVPSKNLALAEKHFQHFDEELLKDYLNENFKVEKIIWHHKQGFMANLFRFLNLAGRLAEMLDKNSNIIKKYSGFLANFYKKNVEIAEKDNGKRIIVVCRKIRKTKVFRTPSPFKNDEKF